jgi:hypothetical protein
MKMSCGHRLDHQTQPRGQTLAVRHSQVTSMIMPDTEKENVIKPLADERQNRVGEDPRRRMVVTNIYYFLQVVELE